MKKFKFKMEYFLFYQMYQKKIYEDKLIKSVQDYVNIKNLYKKDLEKRFSLRKKVLSVTNTVLDPFFYIKKVEDRIEFNLRKKQEKLVKLDNDCKEHKKKWMDTYKKVKMLEILKQKAYKKYFLEMQKEEDNYFNEIFISRKILSKKRI